jgi:hypothetical protein
MAAYTLHNTVEEADLAISGAYRALIVAGTGLARVVPPPTGSYSSGISGYNIAFQNDYFYACTGVNLWGRVQLSSW